MATGDPWCPAHGFTPCRCRDFPTAVPGTTGSSVFLIEKHIDGRWCDDLHCSRCYSEDTWQNAEVTRMREQLRQWKLAHPDDSAEPGPPETPTARKDD